MNCAVLMLISAGVGVALGLFLGLVLGVWWERHHG